MNKGVYILLLRNHECTMPIGALGTLHFSAGWHAYVGSAQGPGGLARVIRHINLNQRKNKKPHWHIDALLLSIYFEIIDIYCIHTDEQIECMLAHRMTGKVIPGFGSSDCSCTGHLFYYAINPHEAIMYTLKSLPKTQYLHEITIHKIPQTPSGEKSERQ